MIAGLVSRTTSKESTAVVATGSVLHIDLDRQFHEQGETNSLAMLGDGSGFSAGLYETIKALDKAANDDKIKGVYLELGQSPNSWATLSQLRTALMNFRQSGKFIYAYGEYMPQRAYYVATAADSIFLNPVGGAEFVGLSSTLAFFKRTLEKLEIQPEIFYAGKFKSATEPFREERMSEANKVQIAALQQSIWSDFLKVVSARTGQDTATVHQWAMTGAVQFPEDAVRLGMIDGTRYKDEVEMSIKSKLGLKEDDKIKLVKLDEYAQSQLPNSKTGESRIAVLFAEGEIVDGERRDDYQIASEDIVKSIRKIRNNDKVKAVVLRVNSPGGSALASEVILRELRLLQEKKPLIVSMGDVAASGGYYISCGADSIFAMPTTITGSIGVFSMMFNMEGLLKNKLGVTFDGVKNAPYADFPAVHRPLNADESKRMQSYVDTIYALFKRRVVAGRDLTESLVDSVAQGRVWSGEDALKFGLVDGLGDLDRALKSAAAKADLSDYQVVTYPEKMDKLESLMRRFSGKSSVNVESTVKEILGVDYNWYKDLSRLQRINGKAMTLMPFQIETK